MRTTFLLTSLATFLGLSLAVPVDDSSVVARASQRPSCKLYNFTLTAAAQNQKYTVTPNASDPNSFPTIIKKRLFVNQAESGSFSIVGRYCTPATKNKNSNTLQLLIHGILFNKEYWSGLGYPDEYDGSRYSWIDHASQQGYPTLSIDRLGVGQSQHPDPVNVVQAPLEAALYYNLIQQLKSKSALPRTFSDLVLVGHSYGSALINNILAKYPTAASKAILTGFSDSGANSLPGFLLQKAKAAAQVAPSRFRGLASNYLTVSDDEAFRNSFFSTVKGHDYDEGVYERSVATVAVVSTGQFLSNFLSSPPVAAGFHGPLLVLTGQNDQAFCGPGSTVLSHGETHCGGILPGTKKLFPKSNYSWFSPNNTGHALNYHYTADYSFSIAYRFLAGERFAQIG